MAIRPLLAACAAALCASGSALAASPDPGWKTHRVPKAGVAIDLPASWTSAAFVAPASGTALSTKASGAAQLAQLAYKNKLVKFFAYTPSTTPVDMMIIEFSSKQNQDHGLTGELSAAAYQMGITGKGMHVEKATFPAGKASTVVVKSTILGLTFEEKDYIFAHAGGTIQLSFTTLADVFPTYAKTFDRFVRSMRYL